MFSNRTLLMILLCVIGINLWGCAIVYHPKIEQGNIITPIQVQAIKPGMTAQQVIGILGAPVLTDVFDNHRMFYVYTVHPGHGKDIKRRVIIYLNQGRVTHYVTHDVK